MSKYVPKSARILATYLFLAPTFFYALRFPLPLYNLGEDLVVLEVLGISFLGFLYSSAINEKHRISIAIFMIFSFVHTSMASFVIGNSMSLEIILKSLRFITYMVVTYIYALHFYDRVLFEHIFTRLFIISLLPFLVYLINDSYFSIHEYSAKRFSGIYGEPSALGPFLSLFIIKSFIERNILFLLGLLIVWFNTDSGSAYVILFSTLLVLLFNYIKKVKNLPWVLLILTLSVLSWNSLGLTDVSAFKKLTGLFTGTDLAAGVAGQSRLQTFLNSLLIMANDGAFWTGYGINVWEALTDGRQDLRVFSFTHFLFTSYGIWALVIIILIVIKTRQMLCYLNRFESLMCVSFLVSALINSAEGSLIWKLGLIYVLMSNKRLRNENIYNSPCL